MGNKTAKTKVLFVITKSNWGGAQKYVYELATGLPKDRFGITVLLGGSGPLVQKLQVAGIHTIPIFSLSRDINLLSDISSFFELWKIFRNEKPDVVHLNSAKAGGVGALSARLAGIPKIIFTAHGWAFNEERPLWQKFIIKFFSYITVLLAHKTIAVSDAVKDDTKSWPFISSKLFVIKNGIKEPNFLDREEARSRLYSITRTTLPSNSFLVGTISELHKSKGLAFAIEAFAKITKENPSIYYFILGGGEEKGRLDALVEHHGLQGRVFMLGFVDEAPRFLKAFDVFLLPSTTEALGLVLLEAGLAGLPAVASNVGGIPEIIVDNETGLLVPSRDIDAISEAINKLVADSALAKRFSETLRQRVLTDFSDKRFIAETIAIYI